jgi:hypothetical protein
MSVVLVSKNFVVFKMKGHNSWAGVGMQEYARQRYILIRKGEWWMALAGTHREWEGRMDKKVLAEAVRRSELTKEVYMGDLNVPFCEECDVEMHEGEGLDGNKRVRYYHCDECGWSVDID